VLSSTSSTRTRAPTVRSPAFALPSRVVARFPRVVAPSRRFARVVAPRVSRWRVFPSSSRPTNGYRADVVGIARRARSIDASSSNTRVVRIARPRVRVARE
jgi:hypothetical protein